MGKRAGAQIKKARLDAGLTQEKLAQKVGGVTAMDISKAERGVLELETETLKKIAKATGVTQASLLGTGTKAAKPTAAKTANAKKTTANRTAAAKKTQEATALTAAERKLVEAYRKADADRRKAAMELLQGGDALSARMQTKGNSVADVVTDVLGTLLGSK